MHWKNLGFLDVGKMLGRYLMMFDAAFLLMLDVPIQAEGHPVSVPEKKRRPTT